MTKIKIIFTIVFILFISQLMGQAGLGNYYVSGSAYHMTTVEDYESIGYNPAGLGNNSTPHKLHIGLGNFGISIYSEPLRRTLVNDLFNNKKTFTSTERNEAVQNFTGSDLFISADAMGLGVAYYHEKFGGFGFSVQEHANWSSNLNQTSADLLFKGYHAEYFDTIIIDGSDTTGFREISQEVSEAFGNSKLSMLWYRDYNLSYGINAINFDKFSLSVGIGVKYIEGFGIFNYEYVNDETDIAYASLSPIFGIDYNADSPSDVNSDKHQSVGKGYGFDLGINMQILNKIKVAMSVINIGSISWDGNVYKVEDSDLEDIDFSGLDNYNIFLADDNILFADGRWGKWEGLKNKKVDLPASLRGGSSYKLNKMFEFGADIYIPLNDVPGNYENPYWGVGTTIKPLKWLDVTTGFVNNGGLGYNIPIGVSLKPINNQNFIWEIGVSTFDVLTWTKQENPTVAFAFGLMRFGFLNKVLKIEE